MKEVIFPMSGSLMFLQPSGACMIQVTLHYHLFNCIYSPPLSLFYTPNGCLTFSASHTFWFDAIFWPLMTIAWETGRQNATQIDLVFLNDLFILTHEK